MAKKRSRRAPNRRKRTGYGTSRKRRGQRKGKTIRIVISGTKTQRRVVKRAVF